MVSPQSPCPPLYFALPPSNMPQCGTGPKLLWSCFCSRHVAPWPDVHGISKYTNTWPHFVVATHLLSCPTAPTLLPQIKCVICFSLLCHFQFDKSIAQFAQFDNNRMLGQLASFIRGSAPANCCHSNPFGRNWSRDCSNRGKAWKWSEEEEGREGSVAWHCWHLPLALFAVKLFAQLC